MMELENSQTHGACIKVIGIGGGGGNAIDTMVESGIEGVQFIAANTDRQALAKSSADVQIQLGMERTKGLGAGSNPTVGQEAAQESATDIQEQLKGADMVFVTAGMGGGTGTGAAPVIAGFARQLGALTVGVVTKPFKFEGGRRRKQAEAGIEKLRQSVDTLITIPNERLLLIAGEQTTVVEAFKLANSVLVDAVRSISDLITQTGLVNTDFADVRTVMNNKGIALMGTGTGEGENRAVEAAERAVNSPLLDDTSIEGASSILINITGPSTMKITEISAAASLVEDAAAENANIIWGQTIDDESESVKVTIIATGFERFDDDGDAMNAASRSGMGQFGSGSYGQSGFMSAPSAQQPSFGTMPVYQDTLSSGSFPPADLARKFQEYDAQSDSMYNVSAQQRPAVSYAPPSSPAASQSSVSAAVPVPDVFAQVGKAEPQPRSSASNPSIPSRNTPAPESASDRAPDDDDIDTPAYLRRNSNKRNYLDF